MFAQQLSKPQSSAEDLLGMGKFNSSTEELRLKTKGVQPETLCAAQLTPLKGGKRNQPCN